MENRSKYRTRQREELLGYLQTMPGEHFTAAELCAHLRERGSSIGQTTVYRQLERMVDEGLLNKYTIDAGSPACFAFIDREKSCGEHCFHCRCERCGRLIHMHCEELEEIQKHLREHHGFYLNPLRTVFYGLCGECARAEGQA